MEDESQSETNQQPNFFENKLNFLRNDIESRLYEYQTDLQSMNRYFGEKYIEKFVCSNELIKKKLEGSNFEIIELKFQIRDLCVLPNQRLICVSIRNIIFFDENFNVIKTIDKIFNKKFLDLKLTCDGKNSVYATESENHRVIKADLEFENCRVAGMKGSEYNEFLNPRGISIQNNILYVCDLGNSRIQKLSTDLMFIEAFNINYDPWLIKTSDKCACVVPFNIPNSIYFYELEKFSLMYKYNGHSGTISEIDSYFYGFNYTRTKIYCYNPDGEPIEELNTDKFVDNFYSVDDGGFVYFNDCVLVTAEDGRKLLKFS